jgi:hypothetical protein
MKNGSIIFKAGFIIIALIIIISSTSGAVIKNSQNKLTSEGFSEKPIGNGMGNMIGEISWDNGLDYDALLRAELGENTSVDAFPADDFTFEEDTIINEVQWIGGYWQQGFNTSHWTWEIAFYEDNGTGTEPGAMYAGNFTFEEGNYNEIFVEEIFNWSIYYKFNVTLPQDVMFSAGVKYWISIWAVGDFFPYSGWAFHYDPIILEQAVFNSYYFFNDTYWYNTTVVLGDPADMCFQLFSEEIPIEDTTPPTVEIIKPVKGLYFRDRFIFPHIIRIAQAIGKLTIEINATDNESGINRVVVYHGPLGRKELANLTEEPYTVLWKRDRIRFVHVHSIKVVAYDNAGNHAHDRIFVRKIW